MLKDLSADSIADFYSRLSKKPEQLAIWMQKKLGFKSNGVLFHKCVNGTFSSDDYYCKEMET